MHLRAWKEKRERQSGFTLIELLVVVAIIGIIAGIAAARFANAPRKAREAVLKTNISTLRDVIDQYYADKRHYPYSLEDLVDEDYLRTIPSDPITGSSETWELVYSDTDEANPDQQQGIFDVRSGAPGTALDGTAYADW
ncbi:MAG: type II secretion system protein [Acidobacteriota bacterium]